MARVAIGALAELPDGRPLAFVVSGHPIVVVRVADRVFAIADRCPHRGFPLHDGTLNGTMLRCRTHGACFDVATGAAVRGPARRPVRTYPVVLENGAVIVEC
jgi:nitrite reductase/ring-hydroxylating ferredoxin subunit